MNINSEASSVDGIRPSHVTAVAQLPPHFSAILCQLALMGEMSKTALRDNLHILGISPASHRRMNSAEMDDALTFLQLQGWLQKTDTRWRLIPGCENPVFLWLLTQPDARDRLLRNTTAFHLRGALHPDRTRLWTAILTGDTVNLPQRLAEWMAGVDYGFSTHPAVSLFADNAGRDIFIRLDKDMQTLLLATALNDASATGSATARTSGCLPAIMSPRCPLFLMHCVARSPCRRCGATSANCWISWKKTEPCLLR